MKKIKVTNETIKDIVKQQVEKYGNNCDLNHIDMSKITDMSHLFSYSSFNGDISNWNVSNVKDMSYMFYNSVFNGDISNWNVSNVTNMRDMFQHSIFNKDISNWNVSNVTDMWCIFYNSSFNKPISKWNVSNVKDMSYMFDNSKFNKPISNWNVSNVTNMRYMFSNSKFNKPISNWNVSNVTNMSHMFCNSIFNKDISNWNVSNVTNMSHMFQYSIFNKDISSWNVSKVKDISYMFDNSKFNQDISSWNVSKVKDISYMFDNCKHKYYINNVGDEKRTIYLNHIDTNIIHIGCFTGTKEEALKKVKEKYGKNSKYYNQVTQLFIKDRQMTQQEFFEEWIEKYQENFNDFVKFIGNKYSSIGLGFHDKNIVIFEGETQTGDYIYQILPFKMLTGLIENFFEENNLEISLIYNKVGYYYNITKTNKSCFEVSSCYSLENKQKTQMFAYLKCAELAERIIRKRKKLILLKKEQIKMKLKKQLF